MHNAGNYHSARLDHHRGKKNTLHKILHGWYMGTQQQLECNGFKLWSHRYLQTMSFGCRKTGGSDMCWLGTDDEGDLGVGFAITSCPVATYSKFDHHSSNQRLMAAIFQRFLSPHIHMIVRLCYWFHTLRLQWAAEGHAGAKSQTKTVVHWLRHPSALCTMFKLSVLASENTTF